MRCTYHRSTRWYGVFQNMYTKSVGAIKSLLPEQASSSRCSRLNNTQYDKRSDALLLEDTDLVGIKVPKLEHTELLLNGDTRRYVISVVGMGGLGEATLVKKVNDDVSVRNQFAHHVWITVSESLKLEELFKDAIRQLFIEERKQLPQELAAMDINKLKSIVKEFLQTKKHIVVYDDVWQLTHWEAIHLAFQACQGLPLAIVVIGSLLATRYQSMGELELFYKRLGAEMERNSQLDRMSKLLCLSYYDLPFHLKNCFLHLSIFPEDFTIYKARIVAHWIGEGFVEKIDGMTLEEVAEDYLNELIDRCLVQVAHTYHDGSIYSIRVHDIIRHIILVKASSRT
ncbi:antimicrobial response protein [Lithospermum erythrorhizon]|uniref:Antimicrobial response protein n=1 Tax=Lithospermum erythrorhizon TaxID=34254 RepID=A0AAV3RCX8_LITER